jgi:predicted DNA-binding protein
MATKGDKKRLHPVNIRLDDEMREELRALAEAENRPLANYIVTVLKEHLAAQRKKRGD